MIHAWDWFCNAVNGNTAGVPSPIAWGAIAAIYGKVVVKDLHAKLDHVIRHSTDIPPFVKPK